MNLAGAHNGRLLDLTRHLPGLGLELGSSTFWCMYTTGEFAANGVTSLTTVTI